MSLSNPPPPKIVNLSLPKTGSTSIAELFIGHGGVHEGMHIKSVNHILGSPNPGKPNEATKDYLLYRQDKIQATIDSATFLHFFGDNITSLWPDSLFLQVVREPLPWLISYLSMIMEFGIALRQNQNPALHIWSKRYANLQCSGLDPVQLPDYLDDFNRFTEIVDGLLSFWNNRTLSTYSLINKLRRHSIILLPQLNESTDILAAAAQVSIDKLPSLSVHNARTNHSALNNQIKILAQDACKELGSLSRASATYTQICLEIGDK